jgi:hypothetical protein
MSAMNVIPMPPKPEELQTDEATIGALRLVKLFFKLRSKSHRERLIMLAEQMLEKDSKGPAGPNG